MIFKKKNFFWAPNVYQNISNQEKANNILEVASPLCLIMKYF